MHVLKQLRRWSNTQRLLFRRKEGAAFARNPQAFVGKRPPKFHRAEQHAFDRGYAIEQMIMQHVV